MRRPTLRLAAPLLALLSVADAAASPQVRIKDLAQVEGVRSNPLLGYGIVVGLQGTGDGTQATFTIQSLANALRRSGISVPQSQIRVRNVAAVMVTADLPPFIRPGQPIDVLVSSIGDAKSLQGGTLLMTPLAGPDGNNYAVAQGAISLGGAFVAGGAGNGVQKNHANSGRIPDGAVVERGLPIAPLGEGPYRLMLKEADFATATRVADAVNAAFGAAVAHTEDSRSIRIVPAGSAPPDPVQLFAKIQAIEVQPDVPARVVINERTGTVVMGADIRVSKVALAHGNLTVEVRTTLTVSQPAPYSRNGQTVTAPQREISTHEDAAKVLTLEDEVSVGELVDALNALGVTSRDMIAIFQSIKAAGALHAELVVL